jgi:hypothetical protein
MTRYGKITAGLIAAWFVFSLTASALHLFRTDPSVPPLPLGLAAGIPIIVFLTWFAGSKGFREFVLSLNPRTLTIVQTWRIGGFTFLTLAAFGLLPRLFAWPAGFGDMAVGVTAPLVALTLASGAHRKRFIVWQLLGITDLVTAVTLGTLARVIIPHGIPTTPMTVLPLSMIPTFAVPLLLILHLVCIAQARRWPARETLRGEEPLHSAAA